MWKLEVPRTLPFVHSLLFDLEEMKFWERAIQNDGNSYLVMQSSFMFFYLVHW